MNQACRGQEACNVLEEFPTKTRDNWLMFAFPSGITENEKNVIAGFNKEVQHLG